MVGPALGGQQGQGVGSSEGAGEVLYLQMRNRTASEHGEAVASHRSDPLSTLPVPQSLLLVLHFHLPSPPSISASSSCPGFVQIFLSLTAAHSLSLLLPAVTLSFHPSLRLHPSAPFVSLLFFTRMPWQKWVLTVPSPYIPVPPLCTPAVHAPLRR